MTYLYILILLQVVQLQAVILKGCGQKKLFWDQQQLEQMEISEIKQKISGRDACCPQQQPLGGYFFHVPKCGGTSVRKMLQSYMEAVGLNFCMHFDNVKIAGAPYYNCVDSIADKKKYLAKIYRGRYLKECRVIASHNDVTLLNTLDTHTEAGQKQLLDIIVLREPIIRQLSELKFIHIQIAKRDISVLKDPNHKKGFLRYIDSSGDKITKLLSGFPGCYDFQHSTIRKGHVSQIHLKKALINLSQFCVIIIMEEPKCGLARLDHVFQYRNSSFLQFPHVNPGLDYQWDSDYLSQGNISNSNDQIVYNYALELNRYQCEQLYFDPHTSQ
eukprot:TRINITY_DN28767_c0_g5_i1.p2 TRINITY_DN28767_c0_g5~~TRINITY_DN28767_c0_g5_i1.p2  ORF type:complete len:346 (+),score=28.79 TRINITY_DN28767_c0_g5_i1:53-1039(+)